MKQLAVNGAENDQTHDSQRDLLSPTETSREFHAHGPESGLKKKKRCDWLMNR